jgi:hypothetical protein
MPAKYEAIRDKMMSEGKGEQAAKSSAAAIFNSQRKKGEAPVTGKSDTHIKRKRKEFKKGNPFKGL